MIRDCLHARALVALTAAALLPTLVGCAGSVARKAGIHPILELAEVPRSQYQIIDTVEGNGQVTTILCLFKTGDSQFGYSGFGGGSGGMLAALAAPRNAAAAATYDAISKVPEADVLMPLTTTASYSGFGCLYRKERATVRGKAIKIKSSR